MLWIGMVFVLVFIGIALRFRVIGEQPCPHCGHRKVEHVIFTLEGVVFGPFQCKRCGKQCIW